VKAELECYGFIINLKKSGKVWKNVVWFVEAAISPDGLCYTHAENAGLSAIFTQRFHYERKLICSQLPKNMQHIVAYHLEMIYGTEFFKSEAFSHINDGGYLSCIEPESGYTQGLYAVAFNLPKDEISGWKQASIAYPSERLSLDTRKLIHRTRKSRWKSGKRLFASDYYILHPIESVEYMHVTDLKQAYPQWAEEIYLKLNLTSGVTVHNLTFNEVVEILCRYPLSSSPISDHMAGKKEYYRIPLGISDEQVEAFGPVVNYETIERDYEQIVQPVYDLFESSNEVQHEVEGIRPPQLEDYNIISERPMVELDITALPIPEDTCALRGDDFSENGEESLGFLYLSSDSVENESSESEE